nr:HD domain-containing protein [Clostridia bacterium]
MSKERLEKQLKFIIELDKMKAVYRQTILVDKSREETDAEHSWHIAVMAMLLREYASPEVDIDRVIRMTLVHDLIEIYAGDTFAYDDGGNSTKEERERQAADKLFAMIDADQAAEFRALWEEFDAMETPDSMFAAAVDRLQPLINNHMTNGHTWVKHGVKSESVYKRMEPIKKAMPELWCFVEHAVQNGLDKGLFIDSNK